MVHNAQGVYLDGVEGSQLLQQIRDALAEVKYIEVVSRPTLCNIQIRQSGQLIQIVAADSSTL